MMRATIRRSWRAWLLAGALLCAASARGEPENIESGGWKTGSLATNSPTQIYYFGGNPNETLLVRVADEDALCNEVPNVTIFYEKYKDGPIVFLDAASNKTISCDLKLTLTNQGVFYAYCTLPDSLLAYSNALSYSFSILRMPNVSLSYDDLDVGEIHSGEYKTGTINAGADLDMATLAVSNTCTVQVRMGQEDTTLYPYIQIYDPNGVLVTSNLPAPADFFCEVTATLSNTGIYTIVCNDYFNGNGKYAVSLIKIPGTLWGTDTDLGTIISGETKNGTINVPGDLDAAFFNAVSGDVAHIVMTEIDSAVDPVIELYNPAGVCLATGTAPFKISAVISNTLTTGGVFTVICKDAYDRYKGVCYSLSMEFSTNSPSIISNKPSPPMDLTASDGAYIDSILLSWTASVSTNVTGYNLWRSTNNITFTQLTTNRPSTTYQDYNVISNILYYYKVAALNNCAISDFSNTNSGFSGSLLPAPVLTLTASDGVYSNYILSSWSASTSTDTTGYDVWRKNWTNDFILISSNWYSQTYKDYAVTSNLIYTYRVQTRNAFGVSDYSPEDTGFCGSTNVLGVRRALLVGIDHYSYGPGDLSACTNDANGMRDTMLLADPSNRWQAANLTTLTDALATKEAIRSNLFAMASASGAGDVALYFQSSHGGQSAGSNPSNTYICTYNANYTDAELGTDLALFRPETTVIIILDTCYSGGMFKLDGTPETEWLFVQRVMEHYQQARERQYKRMGLTAPRDLGANIAFMTACDYNEFSWESDYYGLYTGFLLQGCSLALTDTDLDNQYTFFELHTYAAQKAVQTRPTQHAQSYNPALLNATIARALPTNPTAIHFVNNDFDGDGASDFAAFNPDNGLWRIASFKRWEVLCWDNFVWGGPGFKPTDGDFDSDRASDANVYNEQTGEWRIGSLKRGVVLVPSAVFGGPGLTPVSGDYDGDAYSDAALYGQPDGYWYIYTMAGDQPVWGTSYTGAGFIPVSGDYDGDQINDLAMYHANMGYWYIGSLVKDVIVWGKFFGGTGMVPMAGDYDGDGYSDLAVYQSATGYWYVKSLRFDTTIVNGMQLGGPGYIPVAGDYDGDGYFDLAVYQPATGYWFFRTVDDSLNVAIEYPIGGPGYIPVLPTWQ